MKYCRLESGVDYDSAQIILDLSDSKITMKQSDGTLLKSWDVLDGDWDRLYERICNTFPAYRVSLD